ncbi:MAG: proline dehydrogenase [Gemmatimonadetes bacterium]|nr:proline dehydrogenase [Gemmatimonadota bacterium]
MGLVSTAVARAVPYLPKSLVRRVSDRYIAGDRVDQAIDVVRDLNERGARATIDVLGEEAADFSAVEATVDLYIHVLNEMDRLRLDSGISVKPTGIGLLIDEERCVAELRRLISHAHSIGRYVRIDMEDSRVTDATLRIFSRLRSEFPRVGAVLQACLRRTPDDAALLVEEGADVRLCKGIYREPKSIAWIDAECVRRNFVRTLEILLKGQGHVGIATHDELLVWDSLEMLRRKRTPRKRYEFQMLLGVDRELEQVLLDRAESLRLYVPFGEAWFEYSSRRLRENPAIAGHVLRGMLRRFDSATRAPTFAPQER